MSSRSCSSALVGWLAVVLVGCGACPPGFELQEGFCTPSPYTETGTQPMTPERFEDLYERRRCSALEACGCGDLDLEPCAAACDPPDWGWADGCAFDEALAAQCVDEPWTCAADGLDAYAPPPCDAVYDCGS